MLSATSLLHAHLASTWISVKVNYISFWGFILLLNILVQKKVLFYVEKSLYLFLIDLVLFSQCKEWLWSLVHLCSSCLYIWRQYLASLFNCLSYWCSYHDILRFFSSESPALDSLKLVNVLSLNSELLINAFWIYLLNLIQIHLIGIYLSF